MNIKLQKKKAEAYQLLQAGNLTEAKKLLTVLCNKDKTDAQSLMMLGYIYSQLNDHEMSIQCLIKVTKLRPSEALAHYNLGNAYKAKGDLDRAADAYYRAISIKPGYEMYTNLGNCLAALNKNEQARDCLSQAISIKADDAITHFNLGRVLMRSGLLEEAVESYKCAVELNPEFTAAFNNLGNAYLALGDIAQSGICYDKVLRMDPDSLDALSGKIRLLDKTRQYDDAYELIKPHISSRTNHAGLCSTFADFAHRFDMEEHAVSWLETLINSGSLSTSDQSRLSFLLGKLYDRKKDYNNAFSYFEKANGLVDQPVDFEQLKSYFSSIKSVFSKENLSECVRSYIDTSRPIFIIGMPRSGTSLVEQIIASHPQVAGAGELETINSFIKQINDRVGSGVTYPQAVSYLDSDQISSLANNYLDRLQQVDTKAKYVTDKMPHNFLHLGLIQLLFPGCRVIHCRRNPLDTILSCYFQDFSGNHPYSNDLIKLEKYYRLYADLMTHWEEHLDLSMMTIDYEMLVEDHEGMSKKLLQFCQLEWSDDCLKYYENERIVTTASYDQVRQKVYNQSVNRWRNYEPFIRELISAMQ